MLYKLRFFEKVVKNRLQWILTDSVFPHASCHHNWLYICCAITTGEQTYAKVRGACAGIAIQAVLARGYSRFSSTRYAMIAVCFLPIQPAIVAKRSCRWKISLIHGVYQGVVSGAVAVRSIFRTLRGFVESSSNKHALQPVAGHRIMTWLPGCDTPRTAEAFVAVLLAWRCQYPVKLDTQRPNAELWAAVLIIVHNQRD